MLSLPSRNKNLLGPHLVGWSFTFFLFYPMTDLALYLCPTFSRGVAGSSLYSWLPWSSLRGFEAFRHRWARLSLAIRGLPKEGVREKRFSLLERVKALVGLRARVFFTFCSVRQGRVTPREVACVLLWRAGWQSKLNRDYDAMQNIIKTSWNREPVSFLAEQ